MTNKKDIKLKGATVLRTDGLARSADVKVKIRESGKLIKSDNRAALLRKTGLTPEEEIIVRYRPYAGLEKWLKYRFSAWSTFKAWFAMTLLVLFFGFGGPGFVLASIISLTLGTFDPVKGAAISASAAAKINHFILQIMFFISVGVANSVVALRMVYPTHISLSSCGICLEWHRWIFSRARFIPWEDISHIGLYWPKGKTSLQDSVLSFTNKHNANLRLKVGAIATIEERQKLLTALEKWANDISKDAQILEMLVPAQDHSYTELWLQALSAPPKRERLTPLLPGAMLKDGRYTIINQLGVGGQGTAYLAYANNSNADVVLKEFILPVYVDVNVRRQALERMQNEASMLRRLDNYRVVRLLDFFVEDHRGYLVLERINGISLREKVNRQGPLDEKTVLTLAEQMCDILSYLHSLTPVVVHRDFTPDNLILGEEGVLKLVDFNVAQQTESTATGTVVGKHAYLPPEQFRGKPTSQSDLYAMGATLYFLLVGQDPEPITSSHPILSRSDITPELDELVAHATALDTKERYPNIQAIRYALPIPANPAGAEHP